MATIDEDVWALGREIRQHKSEYDMYCGGGRKRPPTEIEWRIELVVKRYGERGGDMKYGQRFRYGNLAQTYAKYKDIFRKRLASREEGKVQRHFGAAAKAIEAERAKSQPATAAASSAEAAKVFRVVCTAPEKEADKEEQLYEAFVRAKKAAGEEMGKMTHAGFNEFVRTKTEDLQKQKNCHEVEYVVETIDGQVKLKALVKS